MARQRAQMQRRQPLTAADKDAIQNMMDSYGALVGLFSDALAAIPNPTIRDALLARFKAEVMQKGQMEHGTRSG